MRQDLPEVVDQRVTVERVAGATHRAEYESAFGRGCEARFHAEFIGFVGVALRDALWSQCIHRIDLELPFLLLHEHQFQEDHCALVLLESLIENLAFQIAMHTPRVAHPNTRF